MRCAWVLALCAAAISPWPAMLRGQQAASPPDSSDSPPAQASEAGGNPQLRIKQLDRQLLILRKQRNDLLEKLTAEYRARPESRQILQERDEARRSLKIASEKPLATLQQSREYRELLAKKQQLQVRSETLKASRSASAEKQIEAATAYHQAELTLEQMERDAVAADLELIAARTRLARAEAAVARLDTEASDYAITNAEYEKLVEAVVTAREQWSIAQTDLRLIQWAHGLPDPRTEDQKTTEAYERDFALWWFRQYNPRSPSPTVTVTPGKLKQGLPIGNTGR